MVIRAAPSTLIRPVFRGRIQPLYRDAFSWCLVVNAANRPVRFDEHDLVTVATHWWSTARDVIRTRTRQRRGASPLRLHHLLMGKPSNSRVGVHHLNRDRWDHRRVNLRWTTHRISNENRAAQWGRGVTQHANGLFWAQVKHMGVRHRAGPFATAAEANVAARGLRVRYLSSPGDGIGVLPPELPSAAVLESLATPPPAPTWRGLHLRLVHPVACQLEALAKYDTERAGKRVSVTSLADEAFVQYLQDREPELARR
jgi:hypothetical protein